MGLLIVIALMSSFFIIRYGVSNYHKPLRFYIINILIIVIYNLAGRTYIFCKLDAGGASLGPGLLLLLITGVHMVLIVDKTHQNDPTRPDQKAPLCQLKVTTFAKAK